MFSVPPTYQSSLSPRFSNVGYGAYIRYNIPDKEHLGVPDYPLTYAGSIKEGYEPLNSIAQQAAQGELRLDVANAGSAGVEQPIVYDRLIYANKKSRLYGKGDPIRGDLAIAPIQGDWFRPSVQPNIDLREGALTVIGGHDNNTAMQLRALQSEASGRSAIAQKNMQLQNAQADIVVTAFP
jgi:hypothetical protein